MKAESNLLSCSTVDRLSYNHKIQSTLNYSFTHITIVDAMSIDGTFRSSDPRLVWPRTDGNKRNWPEVNVKSGPIQSWYERADM